MPIERPAVRAAPFRKATGGAAAIEFALIVPTLVALYLGSIDLTMGFTGYRKFMHATSAMSDLVTRTNSVSKSDLKAILAIGDATMAPRASRLDGAKITAVAVDSAGKAKASWSVASEKDKKDTSAWAPTIAADTPGSPITLPADFAGMKDITLIRTVAAYTYSPPAASHVVGDLRWEKQIYSQTRTGTGVACTDC